MKETLATINRMQADGVIGKYAIGGAVGATLYLEPSATLDVDIFVEFPGSTNSRLITLSPIYEYLKQRGGRAEAEHIVIGNWPVQFLPANGLLENEALQEAVQTEVEGEPTWVMKPEHLTAIALQTGRPKDYARVLQFLQLETFDKQKLNDIVQRHGLASKWQNFQLKFMHD